MKQQRARGRASVRDGLRHNRNFRILWAGETTSMLGNEISLLVVPITALVVLDADTAELGLLRFFEYLPFLILALPLGVLVDSRRCRPLMVIANAARGLFVGAVPVLAALGWLTLSWLLVLAVGIGTFTVLFDLCLVAYLPNVVGPEHLLAANGRLSASQAASDVAGPGLAGLLLQVLSAPVCLALDACSYFVSVASLLLIDRVEPDSGRARGAPWRNLRDGLCFLACSSRMRAVTLSGGLINLAWAIFQTVFLVYASRVLGFTVGTVGIVLAVGAAGGLVGAVCAPWLTRRFPFGGTCVAAAAASTLPALALALVSGGRQAAVVLLVVVLLALMNGGLTVVNVLLATLRQFVIPAEMLGRVAAGYRTVVFGAISLGGLLTAWLGEVADVHTILHVAGLLFLASLLTILISPIPRIRSVVETAAP